MTKTATKYDPRPQGGFWFEKQVPHKGGPFSTPPLCETKAADPAITAPSYEIGADSRPSFPFRPEDNLTVEEFLDLIR